MKENSSLQNSLESARQEAEAKRLDDIDRVCVSCSVGSCNTADAQEKTITQCLASVLCVRHLLFNMFQARKECQRNNERLLQEEKSRTSRCELVLRIMNFFTACRSPLHTKNGMEESVRVCFHIVSQGMGEY